MDQTETASGEDAPILPHEPTSAAPAAAMPARRSRGGRWLLVLLALALIVGAAGWGTLQWQSWQAERQRSGEWRVLVDQLQAQLDANRGELQQLRERQRTLEQRLGEFGSSNRVLREELLGVGDRAAALEDALSRLARARREGAQALRLEEIDFVLQLAAERLQLFGDVERATQAMRLAADSLEAVDDPAFAGVRQTLAQEIALLRAVSADPRPQLHAALQALQRQLGELPFADASTSTLAADAPQWQRMLDALIRVRRIDEAGAVLTPIERSTRRAALQLQLQLAQSALERGDALLWRAGLDQAQTIFDDLFAADAATTRAAREQLQALQAAEPARTLPTLGAALRELRNLRATRRAAGSSEFVRPGPTPATSSGATDDASDLRVEPADAPELERELP